MVPAGDESEKSGYKKKEIKKSKEKQGITWRK